MFLYLYFVLINIRLFLLLFTEYSAVYISPIYTIQLIIWLEQKHLCWLSIDLFWGFDSSLFEYPNYLFYKINTKGVDTRDDTLRSHSLVQMDHTERTNLTLWYTYLFKVTLNVKYKKCSFNLIWREPTKRRKPHYTSLLKMDVLVWLGV